MVDDHAGFRASARRMLESEGYRVIGEAVDGESALSLVGELHPELVLLDVYLPGIDGFEVASRLASSTTRRRWCSSRVASARTSSHSCRAAERAASCPRTSSREKRSSASSTRRGQATSARMASPLSSAFGMNPRAGPSSSPPKSCGSRLEMRTTALLPLEPRSCRRPGCRRSRGAGCRAARCPGSACGWPRSPPPRRPPRRGPRIPPTRAGDARRHGSPRWSSTMRTVSLMGVYAAAAGG